PTKSLENIEREIKPLIKSINHKTAADNQEISDTKKEPSAEDKSEAKPIPASTKSDPAFQGESILVNGEEDTFIDEELIRQTATVQQHKPKQAAPSLDKKAASPAAIFPTDLKQPQPALDESQDKIVLISVDDDCKDELMEILTNDNFKSVALPGASDIRIDLGKIKINSRPDYKLIAIPVEKGLDHFLESANDSIVGTIFTFDCSRPETWEYTFYLIHSISDKYHIPGVVSVMNIDDQNNLNLDVIRYKLNLPDSISLVTCDESHRSCMGDLLNAILGNAANMDVTNFNIGETAEQKAR
ncbi:MAG: hypothetical protein SCK70_07975, partial [bacterium]|nr:hypothetical protein [bacterium]